MDKMRRRIGSLKFYIILAVIAAIFLPPFAKYQELRYKNNNLGKEIKNLQEEIKKLEIQKQRLQTDITYIESKAREKIGVVRKGEIVIKKAPEKNQFRDTKQ